MRIGKLTNEQLREIVLQKLPPAEDLLLKPTVGEDCAAIRFGDTACVISTDPITGATENAGALAVHVSANDVASSGAQPRWMLATMLVPPDKTAKDVEAVGDELIETAREMGIGIIGGHTEVTDAVSRIVISTTVIGRTEIRNLISSGGAREGDALIMTKTAGLEGTYIIASERKNALAGVLSADEFNEAKALSDQISVALEGVIAAKAGATAMHDVTEGGVFGAVHELCEASGIGCEVDVQSIPVLEMTRKIAAHFGIDPYRLIGSGSMLIAAKDADGMLAALKEAGIQAAKIAVMGGTRVMMRDAEGLREIAPPRADELFSI